MVYISSIKISASSFVNKFNALLTPRNLTILAIALAAIGCIAAFFQCYWNSKPASQKPKENGEVANPKKEDKKPEEIKDLEKIAKKNEEADVSKKADRPLSPQVERVNEIFKETKSPTPKIDGIKNNSKDQPERPLSKESKKGVTDAKVNVKAGQPLPKLKYPNIQLAANECNQYQAGGPAACTPLACDFIASQDPVSPEMIEKLLLGVKHLVDTFANTEDCIGQTNLNVAENPWSSQRDFGPTMQVSFDRHGKTGLSEAVKTLVEEKGICGAIITANGITTAMRKRGNVLEFFDPHGDSTLTHQGNAAYVQ